MPATDQPPPTRIPRSALPVRAAVDRRQVPRRKAEAQLHYATQALLATACAFMAALEGCSTEFVQAGGLELSEAVEAYQQAAAAMYP